MKALAWTAFAAVAAVIATAVVLVAPGPRDYKPPLSATLAPESIRFGDRLVARVEFPGTAKVTASFGPFRVVSLRRERHAYVYSLQCLEQACLTYGSRVRVRFPAAVVRSGGRTVRVAWPVLTVGSRLKLADVKRPRFRPRTPAAPKPSFRIDPGLLGWGLFGIAGMLVLAPGAALVRRKRPCLTVVEPPPAPDLSALEQALIRVEHAGRLDAPERRTALDALALELGSMPALAARARRLAWSPAEPEVWAMRQLVELCRRGEAA